MMQGLKSELTKCWSPTSTSKQATLTLHCTSNILSYLRNKSKPWERFHPLNVWIYIDKMKNSITVSNLSATYIYVITIYELHTFEFPQKCFICPRLTYHITQECFLTSFIVVPFHDTELMMNCNSFI